MSGFVIALLALTQSVQAGDRDWEWDRSTPICTLRQRLASTGETIEVTRTPANDEAELTITMRSRANVPTGKFGDAAVTLYPGDKAVADLFSTINGKKLHLYALAQDSAFIERLANASAVEFSHQQIAPLRVAIRSAATAASALRSCEDVRMREWGIDPIAWRALKSRPIPLEPVRDRFDASNYPPDALAHSLEADAVIRLDVGSDGLVKQCKSLIAGQPKGFEDVSCRVLKGVQFRPALDSAGEPVAAPYVFDVRFRLDN